MSSSSSFAVKALRESFGDRKPPDITRKITACVACRKLKIKCHMNEGNPPCTRCESRGLSCTVNKSLQMLLESDASWKENIERRLENLESAMVPTRNSAASSVTITSGERSRSRKTPAGRASVGPPNMITLNLSCSLGAFPASSMIDLTFSSQQVLFQGQQRPDLISCGVISHHTAEALFSFYHEHLDHCVHYALDPDDTLVKTRPKSPLLTSAICTAAAFCTGSSAYQSCLNALKTEVSRKMFATNHTFDDVRALCIGAFWLSEIASALNGLAVRISTELDLHRCITKMPHTKRACYDRTRLYFLVYLCDRHCSLSHGRPPLTRDFHSLKAPRDFLQSPFSTPYDLSLIAQVELWSISGRVFDIFGADIENPMTSQKSTELESFGTEYDQWFGEWSDLLSASEITTPFSNRLGSLYYHSAKLFLFSHVFRGPSAEIYSAPKEGVDSFASSALSNALAIVRCIVEGHTDTELWLHKLPLYFGTMTAFASVCLLKASCQEQSTTGLDFGETTEYIRRLVDLLRTSLLADPTNPWSSIATSLDIATRGWDLFHPEDEHITTDVDEGFNFGVLDTDGGLNLDRHPD